MSHLEKVQLDRIERAVNKLSEEMRLQEQLNRIEAKLADIHAQQGSMSVDEQEAMTKRLNETADKLADIKS